MVELARLMASVWKKLLMLLLKGAWSAFDEPSLSATNACPSSNVTSESSNEQCYSLRLTTHLNAIAIYHIRSTCKPPMQKPSKTATSVDQAVVHSNGRCPMLW